MEEQESFSIVEGLPSSYLISNFGRVRSLARAVNKSDGRIQHFKERMLKLSLGTTGYLQVHVRENGIRKARSIHQLVARAFIPNPENKPIINHIDGNKLNNHYSNLEWCTMSDNITHAYKLGLRKSNTGPAIAQRIKNSKNKQH